MENKQLIRCIVVDDEHPAVRLLSGYVKRTTGLELVLQTTSAQEALNAVRNGSADLLFLDIQMPEVTGIELMELVKDYPVKVILTTAYPEYALKGYEHDVIDYLLKPVTFERFLIAVAKAKQRIGQLSMGLCNGHLMLKTEYRVQKTDFSSIAYIEGLGDYLIFNTTKGKVITLERMKNMEEMLPRNCFIRIHKSFIINVDKVDYFEKGKIVIDGQPLPVGATYKEAVKLKLGL